MPAERKTGTKPMKSERTHEENQERAYIAASRRSDRSLEARVESARRASEIHKKRTGKALRITEKDVMNEEMYEEEDDEIPQMPFRNALAFYPTFPADARLHAFLQHKFMVQQAMGQIDPKNSLSSSEKYQFTNPQTFNQYALGAAMLTPLPYPNVHNAQQFLSSPSPTVKPPIQQHLVHRFHPYARPNPMQKQPFSTYQSPVFNARNQTPVGQILSPVTQASQVPASPASQPVGSPQEQLQSPVASQFSNRSPNSQARTPSLTNSSASSTPSPTIAESSPMATSPVVSSIRNEQSNVDGFNSSPLGTAFTPDVQTFLSPSYMNSMLHANGYNATNLDFLKSIETLPSTQPTVEQPQFTFSDVFDTSVFNATAHLTNSKACGELQQTTTGGCHYTDISFDANTISGLGDKTSQQSVGANFLSPEVCVEQLKTSANVNNADLFSEAWLSQGSNPWLTDENFWNPLPDLERIDKCSWAA